MNVPQPTPNSFSERQKGVGRGTVITPSDPFSWAMEYLAPIPTQAIAGRREAPPTPSTARERITGMDGRTLAERWVSAHIGPMWLALDRETAERCGLIRLGGLPVFYLATDDIEFFAELTPEQLMRLAEFKRWFLSPEIH